MGQGASLSAVIEDLRPKIQSVNNIFLLILWRNSSVQRFLRFDQFSRSYKVTKSQIQHK